MLLSAVSVLVVAQSSSEIPEGLMNNSVFLVELPTVKVYEILFWSSSNYICTRAQLLICAP